MLQKVYITLEINYQFYNNNYKFFNTPLNERCGKAPLFEFGQVCDCFGH